MKKEYIALDVSVMMFGDEDIITTSAKTLFEFELGDVEESWTELFGS